MSSLCEGSWEGKERMTYESLELSNIPPSVIGPSILPALWWSRQGVMNKNLLKRTVNFRGTKAGLPGPASLSLGRFHLQLPTSEDLEFGFRRKKAILLVYRVFSGERDRSLSLVIKGNQEQWREHLYQSMWSMHQWRRNKLGRKERYRNRCLAAKWRGI